ncbi:hypothetical protein EV426DRAFT_622353 [Tirmania nivea]|nr:hypothetical protein EV426DRAFT_622353 [Tirmania nivea]
MSGGKDVVFGPVRDWGKKGIKVLLKNGEASRQYTLEGVAEWSRVERFRELGGAEVLREAEVRAAKEAERLNGEVGGFGLAYSKEERLSRGTGEILRVQDGTSAERAIEIVSSGMVIQDVTEVGEVPVEAVASTVEEEGEECIETISVRTTEGVRSWVLRTPRTKRIAERGDLSFVLERIDESGSEDSDCEQVMRRKRDKGKGRVVGESLNQMVRDLLPPAPVSSETARCVAPGITEIPDSQESRDVEDSDEEIEDVDREGYVANVGKLGNLNESRHAVRGLSQEEATGIVEEVLKKADEIWGKEKGSGGDRGEDEDMEEGEENDGTTEDSYEVPCDSRGMWSLIDDIIGNLRTIEEIGKVKGGRRYEVRRNLAAARAAVNAAGLMLDLGHAADGTGANSWEELEEDEASEIGDMGKKALVRKAKRGYEKVRDEGTSVLEGVSREVRKLTEIVSTLAALNGIGTPEECEKARKLQARRQAQVAEAKRTTGEVKRVVEKEKEDRAMRKSEEEAKEMALKAIQQVERLEEREEAVKAAAAAEIEEYEALDKNTADPEVVAKLAKRFQEARSQIEKIEARRSRENEVSVGKGLTVIGKKVHRTVTVLMAHKEEIVGVKKSNLQNGATKVTSLLREAAHTDGKTPWSVSVSVVEKGTKKESRWEIGKVPEEVTDRGVAQAARRLVPTRLLALHGQVSSCL